MASADSIRYDIWRAQQRSYAAQAEINRARNEIWSCEQRIAQLRKELRDLEGFRTKSSNDLSRMQSQADERRAAYTSLDSVRNVTAFLTFSTKMKATVNGTRRGIDTARDEIMRQVNRAASDIQREIARLNARIASLQQTIWYNQSIIRQNDYLIWQLSIDLYYAE